MYDIHDKNLHTVLACHFNQTAWPGVTLLYMMQLSNMFTVNFIFCPSNAKFLETHLALEMSLSNA